MNYKNYSLLRTIRNSKKPENTHLFVETSDGDIYFVDSADNKIIYKTEDIGATFSSDGVFDGDNGYTRTYEVRIFFYDTIDERLYVGTSDHIADYEIFYIDLSDDSVTEMKSNTHFDLKLFDMGRGSGKIYLFYAYEWAPTLWYRAMGWWNIDDWDNGYEAGDSRSDLTFVDGSLMVNPPNDDKFWFIYDDNFINCQVFCFDRSAGTFSSREDCGSSTLVPSADQRAVAWDGDDTLFFIIKKSGVDTLYTYAISTDILTMKGPLNIAFMRNTNEYEKAFHLSEDMVYQVHPSYTHLLNISNEDFDNNIIAVNDNYLVTDSASLYEYVQMTGSIIAGKIQTQERSYPKAKIYTSGLVVRYDQYFKLEDVKTISGATATGVVFEGVVEDYKRGVVTEVKLVNLANEINDIRPTGLYVGDGAAILSGIIDDWCDYISTGYLEEGGVSMSFSLSGSQTFKNIADKIANQNLNTWQVYATGDFYYGNNPIDSLVDIISGDKVNIISADEQGKRRNKVFYYGANVGGSKLLSITGDKHSQLEYGIRPYKDDNPFIKDQGVLDSGALNILTRVGSPPLTLDFDYYARPTGFLQVGEKVTFGTGIKIAGWDQNVPTGQYRLNKIEYDLKAQTLKAKASDGLYFEGVEELKEEQLPFDNAVRIQQNTETIQAFSEASGQVEDDPWGAGWDGDQVHAPSQNAVYDVLNPLSGDFASVSGALDDYVIVSGDFADVSGDYATVSGDFSSLSGVLDDYSTFSGDFSDLSGDFVGVSGDTASALQNISEDTTPQLGGNFELSGNCIVYNTGYLDNDHSYEGEIITRNIAGGADFGSGLYINPDGSWRMHDADSYSTMPVVGMALEQGNGYKKVLLKGVVRDDSWNWNVGHTGGMIYAHITLGKFTQTPPGGADDQIQVIGFALTADMMRFDPSKVWAKHT